MDMDLFNTPGQPVLDNALTDFVMAGARRAQVGYGRNPVRGRRQKRQSRAFPCKLYSPRLEAPSPWKAVVWPHIENLSIYDGSLAKTFSRPSQLSPCSCGATCCLHNVVLVERSQRMAMLEILK
jgi:hypothetical protein